MSELHKLSDIVELEAPVVVMVIGVPGSGKSYIAEQVNGLTNTSVVSADVIREELTGAADNRDVSKQAWEELYHRVDQDILNGKSVIVDNTHTVAKIRRRDIARYRLSGAYKVIGIYVETSMKSALSRNSMRERVVPEFVIRRMHNNIITTPPSEADGFDFVITVNNDIV